MGLESPRRGLCARRSAIAAARDPVFARIARRPWGRASARADRRTPPFARWWSRSCTSRSPGTPRPPSIGRLCAAGRAAARRGPRTSWRPPTRRCAAAGSRGRRSRTCATSPRAQDGLPLRGLARLEDEAVVERLVQVKGIGRWTAEMFLMFRLGRLDVLPVDDYGIRKAMQRATGWRCCRSPTACAGGRSPGARTARSRAGTSGGASTWQATIEGAAGSPAGGAAGRAARPTRTRRAARQPRSPARPARRPLRFGTNPEGGVSRLGFSPEDQAARTCG